VNTFFRTPFTISLLGAALLVAPAIPGQQDKPPASTTKEKLAEWPKLADADKERVPNLVGQFRKDANAQEAAKKQLVAMGPGVMPQLFAQISERPDNVNGGLFAVFDALLTPAHAGLMANEMKKPRIELRRYLAIRLCRFADPDLLPVLQSAMTDKDEVTAFHAALGALALKHKDALAPVLAYARNHWMDIAKTVGEVLPRDRDLANHILEGIAKANAIDQMTGLRLVRSVVLPDQKSTVRPYLQASDNAVKREAINVMRVLHGEQPAENLPVFQVIEQANAWLKKV